MRARHEDKYALPADQDALLAAKAAAVMARDEHAGPNGSYLVRSLYLDDANDALLWDNLAGGEPRVKYRLRYYGDDPATLRLEKKTKQRTLGTKEQCPITAEEFAALLRGEALFLAAEADGVKRRLLTEIGMRGLTPKVIVTYAREAFTFPAGNVRVTFDRGLTSSAETDRFLTGDYAARPVYHPGASVLEIKYDELLPRHIRGVLQKESLIRTAYSKYTACRLVHL